MRRRAKDIQLSNNLTSFGNNTSSPFPINDKAFQGVDNFSWIIGKHLLRMGGEYRYNKFPQLGNEFPREQFFFNGQFTNANAGTQPERRLRGRTRLRVASPSSASANF